MEGIEKQRFEIEASAKAFDIIASKLYSQPILAIVRELSTNAVDAHIEAGNRDKKFNVSLPTDLDPYYTIRDFGTGLTPAQVKEVFTVVFKSTKTNSNEVTGCLGLGSKSPFSYVSTYNVESYVDGRVYYFSCFKDEMDIPCVAMTGEAETDEPNGLKISIAVHIADCGKFAAAAKKVYPYLMIKPNFVGGAVTLDEIVYSESGSNWGIMDGVRPNGYTGLVVIMGGVAYPVSQKIDRSELSDVERAFLDVNIDLMLNIGDVDIEAGREGLQFTKRTQNVLKHKFRGIVSFFTDKVLADFKQCKTKWQAYSFAADYNNALGYRLTEHIFNNISIDIDGEIIKPKQRDIPWHDGLYRIIERGGNYRKKKYDYVKPSKNAVILWDDNCKASYARARYYASVNNDKIVYYVYSEDPLGRDKLVTAMGMLPTDVINTSDLPKRPSTKVAKAKSNAPKKKTAAAIKYNGSLQPQNAWTDAVVDIYTPVYYVPIDRYYPVHNNMTLQISVIGDGIKALKELGIVFTDTIYGFRNTLVKKIEKDKNAKVINFLDFVKEKIEAYDKTTDFIQKFVDCDTAKNLSQGQLRGVYEIVAADFAMIKDSNSPLKQIGRVIGSVAPQDYVKFKTMFRFAKAIPGFSKKNPSVDLTKLERDAILKYPFVSVARYADTTTLKSHLIQYINAIDKT